MSDDYSPFRISALFFDCGAYTRTPALYLKHLLLQSFLRLLNHQLFSYIELTVEYGFWFRAQLLVWLRRIIGLGFGFGLGAQVFGLWLSVHFLAVLDNCQALPSS